MARGEAPREAPVPVLGGSVGDGSRVPPRGPLVCRMEAVSLLFDLILINIVNILGPILCISFDVIVHCI